MPGWTVRPLLHLGLTNGDLRNPIGFSGLYAAGNSNVLQDRSGYAGLAMYETPMKYTDSLHAPPGGAEAAIGAGAILALAAAAQPAKDEAARLIGNMATPRDNLNAFWAYNFAIGGIEPGTQALSDQMSLSSDGGAELGERASALKELNGGGSRVSVPVDLDGKGQHDKNSGQRIPTPHVRDVKYNTIPSGPRAGERGRSTVGPVRPATAEDFDAVEKHLSPDGSDG